MAIKIYNKIKTGYNTIWCSIYKNSTQKAAIKFYTLIPMTLSRRTSSYSSLYKQIHLSLEGLSSPERSKLMMLCKAWIQEWITNLHSHTHDFINKDIKMQLPLHANPFITRGLSSEVKVDDVMQGIDMRVVYNHKIFQTYFIVFSKIYSKFYRPVKSPRFRGNPRF